MCLYFGSQAMLHEGWTMAQVSSYQLMACTTGALAGLVGIGGGLVFSPFFLYMGVDPSIAVATSSTCVIFTSSSTTMQYLFTDRIMMCLTFLYGGVCILASYMGTSLVHYLQEIMPGRKSFISGIVAVGVLISAVLSMFKLSD